MNQKTKQKVDELMRIMNNAVWDAMVYGQAVVQLPKEYPGDLEGQDRVYSSILKKYIDTKTGEVIDE